MARTNMIHLDSTEFLTSRVQFDMKLDALPCDERQVNDVDALEREGKGGRHMKPMCMGAESFDDETLSVHVSLVCGVDSARAGNWLHGISRC